MNSERTDLLYRSIKKLLRPLVRILLRYGVSHCEFSEISKQVYVDVAQRDFTLQGRKQTVSRIAVLTGLYRKEVKRIADALQYEELAPPSNNRAVKVVNAWMRDMRYLGAGRIPMDLPIEGEPQSFASLVKEFSGDMPVRAVLDELLASGAVEREGDLVKLCAHAYVPHKNEQQKIDLLGQSTSDLLETIAHNLGHSNDDSRLQLAVAYDNLPTEVVERFRELSGEESQALLLKLNQWLADYDRDINPNVEGKGRYRAGVGIYYFEEFLGDK